MSEELPKGWVWQTVDQVAAPGPYAVAIGPFGSNLLRQDYRDEGVRLVFVRDIKRGSFDGPTVHYVTPSKAKQLHQHTARAGDVLITKMGEPPGDTMIFPNDAPPAIITSDCIKLTPNLNAVDTKYLSFCLRSPAVRQQLEGITKGVAQQKISLVNFRKIALPVPPLAEQRRIVARIEELFARTRQARADLLRIAPLAARYRDQCRRRAFEAEAGWLAQGDELPLPSYEPPRRFEGLPNLPKGWRWAEMSSLGAVTGGITKNRQRVTQPIEIPYLRVANVYADELRLGTIETIRVSEAERERVQLEAGDLLIVEGNGSVDQIGRVAVWSGAIAGCGHQNHLIRVRPRKSIPTRFLVHWLMSPHGRSILEAVASSSSGLHTLSLSKVSTIPVPVAPTRTAETVVATLDDAIASSARTEHEATRALALLDHLERRILARAFRGELVPQDPADEPASVTLARVQGSAALPPRRGRPRRAA